MVDFDWWCPYCCDGLFEEEVEIDDWEEDDDPPLCPDCLEPLVAFEEGE